MPLKSPNLEVQLQERAVKGLPRWKNNRQNWSKTPHGTADNVRVTNINYCRMWERKTAGQVEGEVNMEGQWMKAVFSLGHRTLSNNCPEKAKNWGCLTQGRGREAVKEQRHTDREGINQPTSTHTNRQWRPFWQNTHTPAWLLSAFHLWFLIGWHRASLCRHLVEGWHALFGGGCFFTLTLPFQRSCRLKGQSTPYTFVVSLSVNFFFLL